MGVRALMGFWVFCEMGCSATVDRADPQIAAKISQEDGKGGKDFDIRPSRPSRLPVDPIEDLTVCTQDADCGYDPSRGTCGNDPRYNRQPPLIDQGILCYCEEHRCATL